MVTDLIPESEIPFVDEGWWASLLAEDEAMPAHPEISQQAEIRKPAPQVDWQRAGQLFQDDAILSMSVCGYNRGGLLVEGDGLSGFVPCSHLVNFSPQVAEEDREHCLALYQGKTLRLKIIECLAEEVRLVFSERAARAAAGKRTELFTSLQPGQQASGEVTNITDFGVFVDLGGVEGLIHISELSWGRVIHPSHVLKLGQHVEVIVMAILPERCRIALSLKRRLPNPWETAEAKYPLNAVVPAVITVLASYGAFARLDEGLEGLIHTSEIHLPARATLQSFLSPGQEVQVRILHVDAAHQRLGLSMKISD